MELTPFDSNGDGYFETQAYIMADGSVPYLQMDGDGDQLIDTIATDTNGKGTSDVVSFDTNEDGVPEYTSALPENTVANGQGTTFVITGHTFDVYGASGTMNAAENLAFAAPGGQAVPIDPMAPQPFNTYDHDADQDGYVDALDPAPTQYGNPSPYGY